MKTLHKILAFAMALVMILGLGATAFASTPLTGYSTTYSGGTSSGNDVDESTGAYAVGANSTITITNTKTMTVTVELKWEDDNNRDQVRPSSVNLALMSGDTTVATGTMPTTDDLYYFEDVPMYDSSNNLITNYTVVESGIDTNDYTASYSEIDSNNKIVVTNTHSIATVKVTAEHVWSDSNNQDGMRNTYTLALYAVDGNGNAQKLDADYEKKVDSESDYKSNSLSFTWSDLPKYDTDHNEIKYLVKELTTPDGYTSSTPEYNASMSYTITDSYTPTTVKINVSKVWDDSDKESERPDEVKFILTANGAQVNSIVLNDDNNWTGTFTTDSGGNALANYANGEKIYYAIDEVSDYGYTKNLTNATNQTRTAIANGAQDYEMSLSIKNTFDEESHTSVTVNKVWDKIDSANLLKEPVDIDLYQIVNGKSARVRSVTLSSKNSWTYTWNDLPKQINGDYVTYSVVETTELSGFDSPSVTSNTTTNFTVTNTYSDESVENNLTDVTATTVWNDSNNQDGFRPETVTFTLTAKSGDTTVWSDTQTVDVAQDGSCNYTWNDLLKEYKGTTLTYTLTASDATGYTKNIDKEGYGFTVNYSHTPMQTHFVIDKQWVDGTIENYTVEVSVSNGSKVVGTYELNKANGWMVDTSDSDINEYFPAYSNGELITYTISETNVPDGYSASYTAKGVEDTAAATITSDIVTSGLEFTVTNTYTPGETNFECKVVWDDGNNFEGFRPTFVTVVLYADGVSSRERTPVYAKDGWTYNFTNLPKYNTSGEEIVYTVHGDPRLNYTIIDEVYSDTVTYQHTYKTVSATLQFTWDDSNDQDGMRSETTVTLYQTYGTSTDKVCDIDVTIGYNGEIGSLPEYKDGKKITYSFVVTPQANADKYTFTYDGTSVVASGDTYTLTPDEDGNMSATCVAKHDPEYVTITGNVYWDDSNNVAGKRPSSVVIKLYKDNDEIQSVTVPVDDKTGQTFNFETAVPKYANGKLISYDVKEVTPTGYEIWQDSYGAYDYTVTNRNTFDLTTSITVNKAWVDGEGEGRPDAIGVELYSQSGTDAPAFETSAELNTANSWSYTFSNLPLYVAGEVGTEISYSVKEVAAGINFQE